MAPPVLGPDARRSCLALGEVGLHVALPIEVVGNHGVDVPEGQGGVLLRDLLRRPPLVERPDHGVQRDTGAGDANDAVSIDLERNLASREVEGHGHDSTRQRGRET